MNISHSTWPILLILYNLPPWLCLKSPYWILLLIIPRPKSPGNNIDVYLQLLINELKLLWKVGVETFDAHKKQNFHLRAAVLWTTNDFPTYAMLSDWSTKGELACPCCNKKIVSKRLKHGHKYCYMGHCHFLPEDDAHRKNKTLFDNCKET